MSARETSTRETFLEVSVAVFAAGVLSAVMAGGWLQAVPSLTGPRHPAKPFKTFDEFYPFYLTQHQDPTCQLLHIIGTGLAAFWLGVANMASLHKSLASASLMLLAGLVACEANQGNPDSVMELVAMASTLGFSLLLLNHRLSTVLIALLIAYGCAWAGHFYYEKNTPATFLYPSWSLLGDLRAFATYVQLRLDAA
eukprot:TRINITY_DN4591_c0_g2_i1.p2 TRINITY_DN4591_c0_g2~~TRINITY_DN4591_c0_g2_i1.p2  ORF type:complete len:196 (+),score=65.10 TRINITY_DN4591_c0_g2_i1:65-652(+)